MLDLRDDTGTHEGAGESHSAVEPWPIVNASARLLDDYKQARRGQSDDPQLHLIFGRAALEQNQGLESHAVEALLKYTLAAPDDPAGYYYLGLAYSTRGMHREAAKAYERSLALSPDDGDVLLALHFAYFSQLRFEEAIRCVEQVEKIINRQRKDKLDVRAFHVWKGISLLLSGSDDQVDRLLTTGTGFEGIIGEAAQYGLALRALKCGNQGELAERRSQLDKKKSPLLFALKTAATRGTVEPREAVHALLGGPLLT